MTTAAVFHRKLLHLSVTIWNRKYRHLLQLPSQTTLKLLKLLKLNKLTFYDNIQCPAKTWFYLTPYVCTERIFDSRPFLYRNKYIETEIDSSHLYSSFGTFCVQIGSLFESQWDFEFSEESTSFSFEKTHCASKNWPIWTQKVPKQAQMWATNLYIIFF